jgi:hypothetical protein
MFSHFYTYDSFILVKNYQKFIQLKLLVYFIYKNARLCTMQLFFHLDINLNLKIILNKLKYKYKIMCIEIQVNNNMFKKCNNNYLYVIYFFCLQHK